MTLKVEVILSSVKFRSGNSFTALYWSVNVGFPETRESPVGSRQSSSAELEEILSLSQSQTATRSLSENFSFVIMSSFNFFVVIKTRSQQLFL